jgi:hypothetical protein
MASEKAIYWMTVGVLALAVTKGFVTEYRGWAGRVADRSVAMAEQASAMVAGYVESAMPVQQTHDLQQLACANVRLARAQSALARRRAEIARVQADGIRVRAMAHQVRAVMDWPSENIVVDIPDVQEMLDADTY